MVTLEPADTITVHTVPRKPNTEEDFLVILKRTLQNDSMNVVMIISSM